MSISSATRKAGPFVGSGSTGPFAFTFKVFSSADLLLARLNVTTGAQTILALTTDFTASLNANQDTSPGGTVTLVSALQSNETLVVSSQVALTQSVQLSNLGGWYPQVINDALDRLTILVQQNSEVLARTLSYPISDAALAITLPAAAQRANTLLAFDANGNVVGGPNIASVGTVASNIANINTVATNIANVNTVATNIANVNTVAGISANVTTVAGISANVTTVAGDTANINTVATNITNINTAVANLPSLAGKVSQTSQTGSAIFPAGTTAQRDVAPVGGYLRFNTDTNSPEMYISGAWANVATTNNTLTPSGGWLADLTDFIYPSIDGSWRDLAGGAGYLPYCNNQQWGSAQIGLMPDGSNGDAATQQIQDDTTFAVGSAAGNVNVSSGFKVSENQTPPLQFIKVYKVGNPVDNFQLQVWSDNGSGSPSAAVGVLGAYSGKQITSNTNGTMIAVPVTFPALTANTQYHINASRSGAVDASNYYVIKGTANRKYPHGFVNTGTSVPAWTQVTGSALCFITPNATANRLIQTGGRFGGDNGKLVFMDGNPWNQSKFLGKPMREFWSKTFTDVIRGQSWAASSTIADYAYGIDHDRLAVTVNATGQVVLTWYDSLLGAQTVTGTTDVRTGTHDIGLGISLEGAGADYLWLRVDGVSEGTPLTAKTFTTTNDLRDLGHHIVGGGFPLAPTWAVNTIPTAELSTLGWTYTGAAETSNQFATGNKNYQIANSIGAAASYYSRNPTFVNATGGSAFWKGQVTADGTNPFTLQYEDAAKKVIVSVFGNYIAVNGTGATDFYYQDDFKTRERVIGIHVKGSDYYITVDCKFAVDGTGKATTATANNAFTFGNLTAAAGSDVVTSYVKLSNTGMVIPRASNGASISEYAHWSGDKSALLPIAYNAGSPIAIKQLCGVEKNYVGDGAVFEESRRGISTFSTSSTIPVLISDMDCYIFGGNIEAHGMDTIAPPTVGTFAGENFAVDGVNQETQFNNSTGAYAPINPSAKVKRLYVGLHKVEQRLSTGSGSVACYGAARNMQVRAKN